MALRATIYKADLNIADNDRRYYGSHAITVARHPSETDERMMVRILAYALNAGEGLAFTKGLSDTDEPDLWRKDLTGAIEQWIEVGQPEERRILKACGRAGQVRVYCYGGQASQLWWNGLSGRLSRARNLQVINLRAQAGQALGELAQRTMSLHVNIEDGEVHVATDAGLVSLALETWRD